MSAIPLLPWFPASNPSSAGVTPAHLITAASSLRLGRHLLSRHLRRRRLLLLLLHRFPHQDGYHFDKIPRVEDIWFHGSHLLGRCSLLDTLVGNFSAAHSSFFSSFGGKESGSANVSSVGFQFKSSKRNPLDGRFWTTVILAFNIMVYIAQVASHGRLTLWGAKVNSRIDQGQLWRLVTSSCLHANIGHLLVNSYSLNSIGPIVEQLTGPKRFFAVYLTSAIASSFMSYRYCQSPAVGASGAIFGLVGAYAVFVLRHRSLLGGGKADIQDIARTIALNMVIGLLSRGIDNWGHVGGLLGGVAMAWFVGPAWRYSARAADGRSIFVDRAPIFNFVKRRRLQ